MSENGKVNSNEVERLNAKIKELEKQLESYDFSLFGYPKVIDNAPIAFTRILKDTAGYALVNKEFTRQSGFTRSEFNSLSDAEILELIHKDDLDGFLNAHKKWCEDGFRGTFRHIYRIKNRAGKTIWLDVYYYAELDLKGEPYAVDQIYIDITDRISAQEKVRDSEEKYRRLTESIPAAIFIYSGSAFLYGNEYSSMITGYPLNEILSRNFWEIVHPDFRDMVKQNGIKRQKGEEVPSRYEIKIIHKDGSERWLDYNGTLINFEGRPAVLGVAYDITELKQTQSALIDSEQKYRTLVENMSEVIIYVDNNDRILFVNDNAFDMFGYSKNELLGSRVSELLAAEEYRGFLREKISSGKHGKSERYELKMIKKTGEQIWVEVSGAPLKDSMGNIIGSIGIHSNITERKNYEQFIESSLKQKELLLKEIHHRVKNNLQVITSLIKLQSAQIEDPAILSLFSESQNRIKTMALIHEKLYRSADISLIEYYDYVKNLVNNIYSTYGVSIDKVKPVIEFNSIYLDIDTSIPCGLIINELISNCLKYAFPGGREGHIYLNITEDETGFYILTIKDDGIGIPPEIDIFNTASLGLKLVQILSEQLDGEIEIFRNNGTEFRIKFAKPKYARRT